MSEDLHALLEPERPVPCWGRSRFPVDRPLPPILVLSDLAAILDLGYSRSRELERNGDFTRYELRPRIGHKARYSGEAFEAWLRQRVPLEEAPADDTPARRPHLSAARRLGMARKP